MWTKTCWLSSSALWLIGPYGHIDSLIGPQHTEGSKQEVLIKREGCSIFWLPRQVQPAFCWALSISPSLFLSLSIFFCSCLSHSLSLSSLFPTVCLPAPSFQLCFYLFLSVSITFSIPLSNTVSDLTHSHISFFLSFPYSNFLKIVFCVKWDGGDWLAVFEWERDSARRL